MKYCIVYIGIAELGEVFLDLDGLKVYTDIYTYTDYFFYYSNFFIAGQRKMCHFLSDLGIAPPPFYRVLFK